jgi:hemoglobin-like flavoprotein
MTPSQVQAVKGSFALVRPIADQAGLMFYDRLFQLDPSLRGMFKDDVAEQSRKLMQTLATVVNSLDKLDTIVPAVKALGERHIAYGVKDSHYETVAAALLWTLDKGLGSAFTPDVKTSWIAAYTILADTMKAAAASASERSR